MCQATATPSLSYEELLRQSRPAIVDISGLSPYAEHLASQPEARHSHVGFFGYGSTKAGDRVLIAVDSEYDPIVPTAIAKSLRARGAKVDIITVDKGPNKEFDELDEIRVSIRRESWDNNPRRWEGTPWIEELAGAKKYDLLIHGKGGPVAPTPYRYAMIPWLGVDHFAGPSTIYPRDLQELINVKSWANLWGKGRGGKVRISDPEGTDFSFTLLEEYYDGRYGFTEKPHWGHMFSHPTLPIHERDDTTGIVKGTTNHFSRPFPQITVHLENCAVTKVEGGNEYGAAWREVLEETRNFKYPSFPRPGLFWLWEAAIGTNPKIRRPPNIHLHSSGGHEWERRRAGVIHLGFGTGWRGPEERYAIEHGLTYGHLHVHLLFPTVEVTTKSGETLNVIERGRLTAFDDPEVRDLAAKYGDPDELLRVDWIPEIPGISAPGSYEEYAKNPVPWHYKDK